MTTAGVLNTTAITAIGVSGSAAAAGTIVGTAGVCQGQTKVIYTIPTIAGALSYSWTLPIGASITPSTSAIGKSISVDFSNSASNGNITVQGIGVCSNGVVSPSFAVTVNQIPNVNSVANQAAICNNAFTTAVTFSGAIPATTFDWTNDQPSIGLLGTGTGNIAAFAATNTTATTTTATITVTPKNNGCPGTSTSFTIAVYPAATSNLIANQGLCNGASTTAIVFGGAVAGTVYNWTNDNTSIGLAASGNTDINSFAVINTGSGVATATITVIPVANGCNGASSTFTITASPKPDINSVANQTAICSNAFTTAVTFSGSLPSTTFNWTNDNIATGLAASGTGDINAFAVTNASTNFITSTITVTPVLNGCAGINTSFTIAVKPTPNTNNVPNQGLCNNASTTAVIFSGGVASSSFNWTNDNPAIGLAASGSGDINSFTAINLGNSTVTAIITVIPTANLCDGLSASFSISASPMQTMNNVANQTLCNTATTLPIIFSGATAGSTYNWTNDNPSIGLAATGSNDIASFIVSNTGTSTISGSIVVVPVLNGCSGNSTSFSINTNPSPIITGLSNQTVCNDITTAPILFTGTIAGTTYNWTNDNAAIGLAAMGSGNIQAFKAINTSSTAAIATITIIPSANNCTGIAYQSTITVNNCTVAPEDAFIPEGFSPNGDGINDVLVIRGAQNFPNNKLTVFNRWGDKVFTSNAYKNTWDGTSQIELGIGGNELPIGTYFYILDLGNGSKAMKGSVYLNK